MNKINIIASFLAQGNTLAQAVDLGKQYISHAIGHADDRFLVALRNGIRPLRVFT